MSSTSHLTGSRHTPPASDARGAEALRTARSGGAPGRGGTGSAPSARRSRGATGSSGWENTGRHLGRSLKTPGARPRRSL